MRAVAGLNNSIKSATVLITGSNRQSSMAAQGPATPSALYKMISIPEAQELVLSETQPLPSVSVDLAEAVGSVLAENVQAPENVPPFPASIKVR